MVLPTVRKPEGGFQFISVAHLCAVWEAYAHQRIRLSDVRVWCAAQEMVGRRCRLTPGKQPRYQPEECQSLTGRREGVSAAIARLQHAELLTWQTTTVTFPLPAIETNFFLATMLAQIPNSRRLIPVPRRLLRFLATGCSRVVLATILGHLIRCLYYRQGQCRAEGFCKASWIAEVFGVSPRAVKTARQRLETLGVLLRTETPQWVRNRYGQKMTINLHWNGTVTFVSNASRSTHRFAPSTAQTLAQFAPLDSNKELLTEKRHQKPACAGGPGVLLTLFAKARECLQNGTAWPGAPEPVPPPTHIPLVRRPTSPTSALATSSLPHPHLRDVIAPDLRNMERLLVLHTQAIQAHLIGPSEAERLAFVALAYHVDHFHPANPGGLFICLLHQRHFAVITQEEEDQARRRLNAYLYRSQRSLAMAATA